MALLAAAIKNLLIVLAFALATATPSAAATFSMKRGINLDNWVTWPGEDKWGDPSVILPFPEWRRTLGEERLRALKEAGFDFVRMPIDPAPLMSDNASALREQLYAGVLEAVRLVNAAGLKVVVDMHTVPWGDDRSMSTGMLMEDPAVFDRYVEMLRSMGQMLSGEDPNLVAFELINEPTADCDAGDRTWPDKLKRLFAAARSAATRLTLVLQGSCWSNAEGLSRIDPSEFPDDNLIWTFHSYDPFLLTTQAATWAGDFIRYVTGIPYPPSSVSKEEMDGILEAIRQKIRAEAPASRRAAMLAYLDAQYAEIDTPEELKAVMEKPFQTVDGWAKEHGIPPENIFLGEFGMIRQEYGNPFVMKPEWRAAYVRDMIELAERHGFAWSIWSFGGAFGVLEEFENRPAEGEVLGVVRALP